MNIILGKNNLTDEIRKKYLVLELDWFQLEENQDPISSYAVIEKFNISEISRLENMIDLHENLIKYYRQGNWNYCEEAIEHLMGVWGSELNSFYVNLKDRIKTFKETPPEQNWNGAIKKY